MTADDFVSNLAMFLRDKPAGVTADITDWAVAYWDGDQVVFAFLREDGSCLLDEGFDLADYVWSDWEAEFVAWFDNPVFSTRADLLTWLADAPPVESGG